VALGGHDRSEFPQFRPDVHWLIGRANSLEDRRNDVLHSTLVEVNTPQIAEVMKVKIGAIVPGSGMMNARAAKLAATTWRNGRPLLSDLRLYRDYASALAHFSRSLLLAWQRRARWPERPPLPPLPVGKRIEGP
jgi:hypothetical protein